MVRRVPAGCLTSTLQSLQCIRPRFPVHTQRPSEIFGRIVIILMLLQVVLGKVAKPPLRPSLSTKVSKISVVMLFMVLQRLLPLNLVQALQIHVVSILSAHMRFIIVPKLLLYIVMEALPLMPCAIGLTSALMVLMQIRIVPLRLRAHRRSFT